MTWSASRACRESRDGRIGIVLLQLKAYLPEPFSPAGANTASDSDHIGLLDQGNHPGHGRPVIIPLERRPGSPHLHRQLVDYLRRGIEAGRVPPGARLPAIRDLARSLGVNRETVAGGTRPASMPRRR